MLLARAQSSSCLSASRHPQPSSLSSVSFWRFLLYRRHPCSDSSCPSALLANTQTSLLAGNESIKEELINNCLSDGYSFPPIELVASFVPLPSN